MIKLVRIEAQLAQTYKEVRLAALKQDPLAFGSTYARELLLSDQDWIARANSLDGKDRIGFFAFDDEQALGLVAGFRDSKAPTVGEVISMWVAPAARQHGVGSKLLQAVRQWAREQGMHTLSLMVTNVNAAAVAFYERNGFVRTGRTEPYPNDPDLFEIEMTIPAEGETGAGLGS